MERVSNVLTLAMIAAIGAAFVVTGAAYVAIVLALGAWTTDKAAARQSRLTRNRQRPWVCSRPPRGRGW